MLPSFAHLGTAAAEPAYDSLTLPVVKAATAGADGDYADIGDDASAVAAEDTRFSVYDAALPPLPGVYYSLASPGEGAAASATEVPVAVAVAPAAASGVAPRTDRPASVVRFWRGG